MMFVVRGARYGLVVEIAPNVVDASAVVLPPRDVVEPLELDLRLLALDPVDSDDEFDDAFPRVSGGVPVEAVVEPAGFGGATYFGHDTLWPRPTLATVSPTLATVSFGHFRG